METPPPPKRLGLSYWAAVAGGLVVCFDYLLTLVLVPDLSVYDLEYILLGFALGVCMVVGITLFQRRGERRWLYVLMASSLLSLFLYVSLISFLGATMGSLDAIYLITKTRTVRVRPDEGSRPVSA
ncbi:MAG TPA: hypothetical protein VMS77_05110 [Conexivisphaerales archaeon]|nr:hypothetical protein [Conexivisphaerales archaeon]